MSPARIVAAERGISADGSDVSALPGSAAARKVRDDQREHADEDQHDRELAVPMRSCVPVVAVVSRMNVKELVHAESVGDQRRRRPDPGHHRALAGEARAFDGEDRRV
jgi:hypothetical protein